MKNSSTGAAERGSLYQTRRFRQLVHSAPVSHAMARILGPARCGRAVGRMLRPLVLPGELNVLAVGRELFFKDIEQVEQREGIHFVSWRSGHLGRLQAAWTPAAYQRQGHFFAEPGAKDHPCWGKSADLFAAVHRSLEQAGPVPVVMSANVDYWQETALRDYCTEQGVAHLVLCRENLVIPHFRDRVVARHRECNFRFHGHVAVFSEHMKQVLIDSGACRPEQISVTGAPRTDLWLDPRPETERDTVTLLSFRTSLLPDLFVETVEHFVEAARAHPHLRFVIKCKEGRGDYDWMKQKAAALDAPSNVQPVQYGDLRSLLERSAVIIGFNTLALTEALLTRAALIVPSWRDTAACREKLMLDPDDPTLQDEFLFCKEASHFCGMLDDALRCTVPADPAARLRLVNRYLHFTPSESSSFRVAQQIKKLAGDLQSERRARTISSKEP